MPRAPAHNATKRKRKPTLLSNLTTTAVQTNPRFDEEPPEHCLKKPTSQAMANVIATKDLPTNPTQPTAPPSQTAACLSLWETAKLSASSAAVKLADFQHQATTLAKELDKMIAPMLLAYPELSKPLAEDLANAFRAAIGQTIVAHAGSSSCKENTQKPAKIIRRSSKPKAQLYFLPRKTASRQLTALSTGESRCPYHGAASGWPSRPFRTDSCNPCKSKQRDNVRFSS